MGCWCSSVDPGHTHMGQARNLFPLPPHFSEILPAAITGPYRSDFIPNCPPGSALVVDACGLDFAQSNMPLHHPTTTLQPPEMTLGMAVGRAPSVAWRQLPRPTVSVIGHTKARAASAASAALLLPGRGQNRRLATGAGSATGYTAREGKVRESRSRLRFSSVRNSLSQPFPGWCFAQLLAAHVRFVQLAAAAALVLSGGVAWAVSRPVVRLEDEEATQDRGRDRDENLPLISAREIRKHNAEGDCWIVIQGNVYECVGDRVSPVEWVTTHNCCR